MLPVSAQDTIVHNYVVAKSVVEKFSHSELKIEKIKFFTQSSTKFFTLAFLTLEVAYQVA